MIASGPALAVFLAVTSPAATAPAARALTAVVTDAPGCELDDAYLRVRLDGALVRRFTWTAAEMRCTGMRRPDGTGIRITFSGDAQQASLVFVFGVPKLAEGASGEAVPVNVTVIHEGGALYGTQGADKCLLDHIEQTALTPGAGGRRWKVAARGFCLEPARAVGAAPAAGAILLATFDFVGLVTWEADSREP